MLFVVLCWRFLRRDVPVLYFELTRKCLLFSLSLSPSFAVSFRSHFLALLKITVSLHLSLSPSLLNTSLPVSFSLSVSIPLSVSVSLFLSLSVCLSVSLSLCLSLSFSSKVELYLTILSSTVNFRANLN